MTWYYELDEPNTRVRLRYVDDSGTVHGPRDISWPDAPARTIASDDWLVDPNVKEEAGDAATDMWQAGNQLIAIQMLRDGAFGDVQAGTP